MAAPGTAPIHITLDPASAGAGTDDLLAAMLRANPHVSDVIFSPGRTLQVQVNGALLSVTMPGLTFFTADDTRRIASHLLGNNKAAIALLREQGYCDISYALPGVARFRVNVFIQRGSCAVVMRVIPTTIPDLKTLGAPEQMRTVGSLRDGLVLVTGPRGSGKSSTLAALVDHINESTACHIITIEDPIEFLYMHKRATVHQRELHSDTPSITHAMRAAMRQAPNVIVVGELKERDTIELALEAAETGHLVLSTMNTLSAAKAVERMVAALSTNDESATRARLARVLRCVVCQRLIPRKLDGDPVAVFETVAAGSPLLGLQSCGTHSFTCDGECGLDAKIEKLARTGTITPEAALAHAVDADSLSRRLHATPKPQSH